MSTHTKLTGPDLIEWLQYRSGWKTRDVPGVEISVMSHCYHDVIDEIERQGREIARLEEALASWRKHSAEVGMRLNQQNAEGGK